MLGILSIAGSMARNADKRRGAARLCELVRGHKMITRYSDLEPVPLLAVAVAASQDKKLFRADYLCARGRVSQAERDCRACMPGYLGDQPVFSAQWKNKGDF